MKRTVNGKAAVKEVSEDVKVHLKLLAYDLEVVQHSYFEKLHVNIFLMNEEHTEEDAPVCTFQFELASNRAESYRATFHTDYENGWLDWNAIRLDIAKLLLCELSAIDAPAQVTNKPIDLVNAFDDLSIPRMVHDIRITHKAIVAPEVLDNDLKPYLAEYDESGYTYTLPDVLYAANDKEARAKYAKFLDDYRLENWLTQGSKVKEVTSSLTWYRINRVNGSIIEESN